VTDVLTTSQRITARAQLDRAAAALSDAVDAWRRAPTAENVIAMCERHDEYKAARGW
jgi:hypothetical protein